MDISRCLLSKTAFHRGNPTRSPATEKTETTKTGCTEKEVLDSLEIAKITQKQRLQQMAQPLSFLPSKASIRHCRPDNCIKRKGVQGTVDWMKSLLQGRMKSKRATILSQKG